MVILEKLASTDSGFTYNFCVYELNEITGFCLDDFSHEIESTSFWVFHLSRLYEKENECAFMAIYWSCCHE